jgi:hypothetical protein
MLILMEIEKRIKCRDMELVESVEALMRIVE